MRPILCHPLRPRSLAVCVAAILSLNTGRAKPQVAIRADAVNRDVGCDPVHIQRIRGEIDEHSLQSAAQIDRL